jgi:hypothetical protein
VKTGYVEAPKSIDNEGTNFAMRESQEVAGSSGRTDRLRLSGPYPDVCDAVNPRTKNGKGIPERLPVTKKFCNG